MREEQRETAFTRIRQAALRVRAGFGQTSIFTHMSTHGPARLLPTIAAVAILGAIPIGTAVAPAQTGLAAAKKITPKGAGGVNLGAPYNKLHRRRLVGKIHKGCELGPNTRSAKLRAPLKGSVDFSLTSPRKVTNISISGGATARGAGIGAELADINAAYPQAKVDHTTEGTLGITLVKIPKNGGGKLQFAVDIKTKKVSLIGIPFIAFCE